MIGYHLVEQQAVDLWGEKQIGICIEEMAELTKELSKWQRGMGDLDHISEEMADVEITLQEMLLLFRNHRAVEQWQKQKLLRLADRIDDARIEGVCE